MYDHDYDADHAQHSQRVNVSYDAARSLLIRPHKFRRESLQEQVLLSIEKHDRIIALAAATLRHPEPRRARVDLCVRRAPTASGIVRVAFSVVCPHGILIRGHRCWRRRRLQVLGVSPLGIFGAVALVGGIRVVVCFAKHVCLTYMCCYITSTC